MSTLATKQLRPGLYTGSFQGDGSLLTNVSASWFNPNQLSSSVAAAGFGDVFQSQLEAYTSLEQFQAKTASLDTKINVLEQTTSSLNTKTGSIDTKILGLELVTSSLNLKTGSIEQSISNLNTKSSSYDASISSLNANTASYVRNNQTSSMSVATSSFALFAADTATIGNGITEYQDFTSGVVVGSTPIDGWYFPSGQGTVATFQKTNWIGGINIQTGTGGTGQQVIYNSANGGSLTFSPYLYRTSSAEITFRSLVQPILIPTGSSENTGMLIGFVDSAATGTLTNGFRFEYFFSGSAVTWFCRTASASLSTLVNTGVTVAAGSDYYLSARVQGTTASFYINSELVATSSTNIPTNVYLSPLFSARITGYRSGGGGNHQLGIDYFDYRYINSAINRPTSWIL